MLLEEILFPPFGQAYFIQKTFYFKYRAPYFNKILMFGIATKTKITRGKPTWKIFVFRLRSFHRLEGWEKKQKNSKKTKKNKETKKNKVLGEMLCPRVSSTGLFFLVSLVFWVSLVFLVFFEFFWFFSQQSWEKCCAQEFPPRDRFFGFFVFFGFLRVFFVFRLGSFHRLQGWEKKQKKLEENQKKTKKPKKPKTWEKCCAQGFPPGDWFFCFFWFFWFLCFFWFSSSFFGF